MKVKDHNIIVAISIMPEGRTAAQMTEELTTRKGLFAIFINPQNEMHRSLTLNILHGTPQGKQIGMCKYKIPKFLFFISVTMFSFFPFLMMSKKHFLSFCF